MPFSLTELLSISPEVRKIQQLPQGRRQLFRRRIGGHGAGGAFDTLRSLAAKGLGDRAGNGKQFVSWIHHEDFVRAIRWIIDGDIDGVVNVAAPEPQPNAAFMKALRVAMDVRVGLPASEWMLELGALLMPTETELILKSRRVVPRRLLDLGVTFRFPHWPEAANDLCRRDR